MHLCIYKIQYITVTKCACKTPKANSLILFKRSYCWSLNVSKKHKRSRYYATFKVRKYESLFYKINTCLQKTTTCIGLRTEHIFSVNIYYTYFSIFGVAFTVPFLCYFQKLQPLVVKKFWTNSCCFVVLHLWAQIFKILFQSGNINIFVFCVAFFNIYVQLKSPFLTKKTSAVKSETHFSIEAIEN